MNRGSKRIGGNERLARCLSRALAFTGLLLVTAGSAWALPASVDPTFGFLPTNLDTIGGPLTIGAEDPFLMAGRAGSAPGGGDPDVIVGPMNADVCILAQSDNVCRPGLFGNDRAGQPFSIDGPFSVIVAVEITSAAAGVFDGEPFSLLLTGLAPASPTSEDWSRTEVQIELAPSLPMGLDTSELDNFLFTGSFSPLTHVIDDTFVDVGVTYNYIGFTNVNVGDIISFRYEVTAPRGSRQFRPELMLNATTVVPEPGTALLMGLGLFGLSACGRRIGRDLGETADDQLLRS